MKGRGFTLIEILIYVGIFAIVGGLLTGILLNATRVEQRESASAEVTSQLNFVMQTIQRLVRQSSNIEIDAGTTTSTLKLRMKDSTKDPTYISLSSDAVQLKEGSSATTTLTSDRVVVNTLNFKKFTQYPGHDTVSIDLTMTYNTQNTGSQVQRTLSSAIARVSAATFDSDILPGADNTYSIGFNPSTRWKDGTFAGNLTINGNVGIGTTSPQAKLEITGTAGAQTLRLNTISQSSTTSPFGIVFRNDVATGAGYQGFGLEAAYNGTFRIEREGSTSAVFALDQNGNVGIGTINPLSMLDVRGSLSVGDASQVGTLAVGNGGNADARISGYFASVLNSASANQWGVRAEPTCSSSTTGSCRALQVTAMTAAAAYTVGSSYGLYVGDATKGAGSSITTNYGVYVAPQGSGSTNYGIYSDSTGINYFGGNVGIGTSTPASILHVNNTASAGGSDVRSATFSFSQIANRGISLGLDAGNNATLSTIVDGSNTATLVVRTKDAGTVKEAMFFSGTGYVAVNYFDSATSNNVCYNSTVHNGYNAPYLATCSSARRYKENISDLMIDKDKVFQLRPVSFKWKNRDEKGVGLIAEEVEQVIPELVTYYKGQVEGVRYGELSVYLLDIIKQHDRQISSLVAENGALKQVVCADHPREKICQ